MATYKELLSELNRGVIRSVYVFSGEDAYLKEEALTKIKKLIVDPAYETFNYHLAYGSDIMAAGGANTLLNICYTVPFFSKKKLVAVKDADELCKEDVVAEYAANPVAETCLIVFAQKPGKDLKKFEIIFYHFFPNELAGWVNNRFREAGKKIAGPAVELLTVEAGDDLNLLSGEIEKLVIYTGKRDAVTEADVRAVCSGGHSSSVWDMVDAAAERRRSAALGLLKELFDEGEAPVYIVAMLGRQFRLVMQAKEMAEKKRSYTEIGNALGLRQQRHLGKVMEQARKFSVRELEKNLGYLVSAEFDLKTGRVDDGLKGRTIVEILIGRLCGEKRAGLL